MSTATALTIYDRIANPVDAVKSFGKSIALSGMFGCGSEAQGEVLALECLARRMPPLMLAEKYHFIKGKLSMKADAMLAEFHRLGGKVKEIERSAKAAKVELSIDGQTSIYSLTWEEAAAEPFVYEGKESEVVAALAAGKKLTVKPKYSTPRARMQMLWARVTSDGVRAICPQVNHGRYTPEELGDDGDDESNGYAANGHAIAGEVVDAEFTVEKSATAEPEKPAAAEPAKSDKPAKTDAAVACSADEAARIGQLFSDCGISPEDRKAVLDKRGAKAIRNLTAVAAADLITKLEAKLAALKAAEAPTEAAQPSQSEFEANQNSPSTPEQVAEAKLLLTELEQAKPGALAKLQAKLNDAGYRKLAELKWPAMASLLGGLRRKNLEAFFEASLAPKN